jgi:hypothetical protein
LTLKHGYMRYDLRQSSGMYTMLGSHRDWAGNSNIQKLILVTGSTREGMTRLSSPVMALSQSQSLGHTVTRFVRLPLWDVSAGLAWRAIILVAGVRNSPQKV